MDNLLILFSSKVTGKSNPAISFANYHKYSDNIRAGGYEEAKCKDGMY